MDEQGHTPNGAGLRVLACFEARSRVDYDPLPRRSRHELARLTGLPMITLEHQLGRLTRQGYLERTSDHRYRLTRRLLGDREIVITSTCHSRTTEKRGCDLPGDHCATSAPA